VQRDELNRGNKDGFLTVKTRHDSKGRRRGNGTPATSQGRRGARDRQQVARGCNLPPCAAPRRLHGDEAAAGSRFRRRRRKLELGFRRLAEETRAAARARVGAPGGCSGLKVSATRPWRVCPSWTAWLRWRGRTRG
jgi:hypothetical protein